VEAPTDWFASVESFGVTFSMLRFAAFGPEKPPAAMTVSEPRSAAPFSARLPLIVMFADPRLKRFWSHTSTVSRNVFSFDLPPRKITSAEAPVATAARS